MLVRLHDATRCLRPILAFTLLALECTAAAADGRKEVEALLAQSEPPRGVVFEIVSGDEARLEALLPIIRTHSSALKQRFPGIEVAIVSHGQEQFSLLRNKQERYAELHDQLASLVKDGGVPLHVCGGHASWRDKDAKDFLGFVEVAPSGPAQVRNYQDLGYVLILL